MRLYAFSSIDRILTENFAFWTCASCLRIVDFIHLHGTFLTYLKILINSFLLSLHMNLPNSFVRSMKAKLSHRIRKSSHVRTIKIDPALRALPLCRIDTPHARIARRRASADGGRGRWACDMQQHAAPPDVDDTAHGVPLPVGQQYIGVAGVDLPERVQRTHTLVGPSCGGGITTSCGVRIA